MNPLVLYDNKLLTSTLTVNGTYAGYDVQNILDYRPYTFWKAAAGGTNWLKGYWAAAQAVDAVGICGHNFNSVAATIYVEHSNDSINWITATSLTPANDNAILLSFTSQTKNYWRIRIENIVGNPYLGVLFFGSALQFEHPPTAPLVPKIKSLKAESVQSESGNFLGANVKFAQYELNHSFSDFTSNWYDNSFEPFLTNHAELLKPFFYAWDLINKPNDIFYVKLKDDNNRADTISRLNYVDTLNLNMVGRK